MTKKPLYLQLANSLRSQILSGELGGTMPPESALQHEFGVSRSVVRQALELLRAEGYIDKSQGRTTQILTPQRLHRHVQSLNGLGMQAESMGCPVRTDVLAWQSAEFEHPPQGWETLDAIRVTRLRYVDEEPFAVIITKIPRPLADLLEPAALDYGSLHEQMRGLGQGPVQSKRTVMAQPARQDLADLLTVAVGDPLLVLSGTTYRDDGALVEEFTTYHRADRIAFDLETTI